MDGWIDDARVIAKPLHVEQAYRLNNEPTNELMTKKQKSAFATVVIHVCIIVGNLTSAALAVLHTAGHSHV